MPALDQRDQVADGLGVDGVKWLVEQDQVGILHQHAGEQGALQLAPGKRVERALFKAFEPDGHQRLADGGAVLRRKPAKQPASWPQAERDQVNHPRRKAAVEFRLLWQIGDAHAGHLDDTARHRPQHPDNALHERGFAGAIGTDDRSQRTLLDRAIQMMDGRVAAIAQGKVAEGKGGSAHGSR